MSAHTVLDVRVVGVPIAQGRPRAFKTPAGQVRVYDPATSRNWKWAVCAQVAQVRGSLTPPECGPLVVDLEFFLPRPKSLPKRVRHPIRRPDLDNLLKAVLDAMNGVVYRDDAQIIQLIVTKRYGERPGVQIRVTAIDS